MRQVEYRGYARGQGFNPIQVPDSTRKIAQRDEAYTAGMQRYASQLQANRQNYQQGMERKFAAEEQNRRENFQWQEKEAERYQNAVLRNIETERQNAATAAQFVGQDKGVLQALSGLSQTISKGLVEYDKKVSAEQEAEGKSLVLENGLNPALIARYQAQKAALSESDRRINSVANQLDFEGVPVSVIEQYLNLSGWKRVGATASLVQQGADNYPLYALQMKSSGQTLDIGNGEFDIGKPRSPEEYKAVEAYLRTEYLKNFNGISDTVLNEYLYPGMRQFEANERGQYFSEYEKNVSSRIQGERASDLITNARASGGAGLLDWVNRTSGGDRNLIGETRRQGFATLAEAIKTGQMSPGEWQAIKDYEFVPRGQSKPVTIGEYYGSEASLVDNAVAQKERDDYEQKRAERAFANEEFDGLVRQKIFGEGATDEEVEQIIEQYNRNGFSVPEFLKSYRTQETKNKEDQREQLIYLSNRNLLTTEELLRPGKYSEELIAQFKSQASAGDQLKGLNSQNVDGSLKIIEARMSELLKQTGTDTKASSALLMGMQKAEDIFNRKVLTELRAHGDENLAIEKAQEYVMTLLWNGIGAEQKNGPFTTTGQIGSLSPFAFMQGTSGSAADEVAKMNRIRSNPQILNSQVILSQPELQEIERFRQGKGSIPASIMRLAKVTGKPAVDIINAQLTAAGKPPLAPVMSETIRQGMSPLQQKILNYRPSAGNTYQAFGMNPGDGTQPWKPLLDLIASKESADYGHYHAMNTGGSNGGHVAHGSADSRNVFPGGITKMTVGQILELQRQGKIHAAGRYQIINTKKAPTLSGLMRGAYGPTGVEMTDIFDAATQDKLAIALVRGRAGKFFNGTGTLQNAVRGMGEEWIGLQKLPAQKIGQLLEQTRQVLNSPSPFRQPEAVKMKVLSQIGKQVSSIVKENPSSGSFQPGMDLFFEDKNFKALLPGRVKEIGREGGYGNFVVVESTDPKTGELVDVLYSHIADGSIGVREGDTIQPGQTFARQGGTGRVRSADGTIASVDFLAPAPKGSGSMAPYKRWSQLADEIAAGLRQRS